MSGGGGGGQTQTTQIDSRFDPLISYATETAGRVNSQGFTPYSGERYADLNRLQDYGLNQIQRRAQYGDPTIQSGENFLQDTLQSGPATAAVNPYAEQGNPYLDQMVQRAQDSVLSNANTSMVNSGSFGNSGIQEVTGRNLGDVATQMYGNAWNTQAQLGESQAAREDQMYRDSMGQKLNAANLGLTYGNQDYADAAQLMKAGQVQQDQTQQGLDFNYQQFQDEQNLPYKQMGAYQGLLSSSGANATTTRSGGGK